MGKIAPVSSKYIIHATIDVDGMVEKPDVIGAIFGQTEGLLGQELELRELQKTGKIGRIEVDLEVDKGKASGQITIPSSLDKTQTALIGAAIETIERIGPCEAKIKVEKVEDVRSSKREFLLSRAKDLLKDMTAETDTREISEEVAYSTRQQDIVEYGKDKLSAGTDVAASDEVIIVEGRADVLNLLKYGIRNVIAMNGTGIPETIVELCKEKKAVVFVDGDRGGDLIIKELTSVASIQGYVKAPDGKEVEELTGKEIFKALRSVQKVGEAGNSPRRYKEETRKPRIPAELASSFRSMLRELENSGGAYLLDEDMNILGKVPVKELEQTLKNLEDIYAVVMDDEITDSLVSEAARYKVRYVVGMTGRAKPKKGIIFLVKEDL